MINAKLQNIIDTKSAIGNAINNKGGSITGETPFYEYAPAIENISTGGGAYSTFVAQAQDNSKYTVYTGYDSQTNPTPNLSNNFAFNRWLLNNSATGDIVLSNVVVANGGTFNGPNSAINEALMPFVSNVSASSPLEVIKINNGFIFTGTSGNQTVQKFHESNLTFNINSQNYGGGIYGLAINNSFVYAGGQTNQTVQKFHESNLVRVGNTANYGGLIRSVITNNGFIYAGGSTNRTVQKFGESNLTRVGNTSLYDEGDILTMTSNNGFIYVAGGGFNRVFKYHESNLAFAGNSTNYGSLVWSIATNNGFVYTAGQTVGDIKKYHESNLVLVGNTANFGKTIYEINISNGFIYAAGEVGGFANAQVQKFYESNLAFVGNTANTPGWYLTVGINNGFIYAGGSNQTIQKFETSGEGFEQLSFYNITNIKE
jgi:hypothetical protein